MMSQLDHIENRIRWRATKNAVQTSNTGFWETAPESLKERAGAALEKPVFFSMADDSTATILGADGTLLVDGRETRMIPHIDLGGVFCEEVGIAAPQDKASSLRLAVRNRGTVTARMEEGPANYFVWKALRMLLGMREAWFRPEPVEERPALENPEPSADDATAESGESGRPEAGGDAASEVEGAAAGGAESDAAESAKEKEPAAELEKGKPANDATRSDPA